MHAPLLISLPHGLNASGVTTWAVRLVNALARAGRPAGLIVHDEPAGQHAIDFAIDPLVEVFDARGLRPMESCAGDLSPYLPVYRLAVGVLAARAPGGPVVCSPNLLGDCYGVFAELSRQMPHLVRTIAVHHADIPYNDLVCSHYAPMLGAVVGVSERITSRLRGAFPSRGPDVYGIPYGVEVPGGVRQREPLAGRPIRLLYSGRMDHEQKRVLALVALSDEFNRRGHGHELALLGDGPAAPEIDEACTQRPSMRRFGATTPAGVADALDAADCFVLTSRYEGLSIALLEALARGCVPVLTPSRSGTAQLVADAETGFLAQAGSDTDHEQTGVAMANAIERALRRGDARLHEIRERGRSLVGGRFAVELCAKRYGAVIDRVANAPPRPWPAHRSAAFTGSGGGGSGTVPTDAAARLAATLGALEGKRVAVFGTGRHTLELRDTMVRTPADIVAFLDDDAARHGERLFAIPIVAPERADEMGVSDIVISSWLHQDTIAARCAGLEAAGLRVHRIYASSALPATVPSRV
jgi:glycosyltransferase involved in cell wall biosynthesis